MSDIESSDWNETAGSNNASPPNGAPEGQAPSTLNDCLREIMAAIKRDWNRSHPTVTSGGSANAQTLTYGAGPAGYTQGLEFCFIAGFTNTAAATLNVNGLGPRNIFMDGVALAGGEIVAGCAVKTVYDGTQFQITSGRVAATFPGGFKNWLINADMEIWQRGAGGSSSIAIAASTASYGPDRWYLINGTGQACVISQQAGLTDRSRYCARVLRNSGQTGIGTMGIAQPLTTDMVVALRGQPITISAKLRSGANFSPTSGQVTVRLIVGTGAEGKGNAGFTSQSTVATTAANLGTSSAVTAVSATSAAVLPTNATQAELQILWTPVGTAGAADYVEIDEVTIEIGNIATGFDRRPFLDELARCGRFFQKSFKYVDAPAQGIDSELVYVYLPTGGSGLFGVHIPLPVRMRVAPTCLTYNPAQANANWRDLTNSTDKTVTVTSAGTSSLNIRGTAGVANSILIIAYQLDAEL